MRRGSRGLGTQGLRACEAALRERGLFFIQTPGQAVSDRIPEDVAAYLRDPAARKGLPHANQIWMLFGFEVFKVLSGEGWGCLEVYPQATVRVIGAGERHKKSAVAGGWALELAWAYHDRDAGGLRGAPSRGGAGRRLSSSAGAGVLPAGVGAVRAVRAPCGPQHEGLSAPTSGTAFSSKRATSVSQHDPLVALRRVRVLRLDAIPRVTVMR